MDVYFGFGSKGTFKNIKTNKPNEITIYLGKVEDEESMYLFFVFFAVKIKKNSRKNYSDMGKMRPTI